MKFSREAAVSLCRMAAASGCVVARIEGGVWHDPGFEARLDSIWDGAEPPISLVGAAANNDRAAEHISGERLDYDTFVITAPPVTGWPHKSITGNKKH